MQKRALLIGSSFSAAPMLFCLKKRNIHVTSIGKYKTDPCHLYSDESIYEDYSDKHKLFEIIQSGNYDYIVPSCNDFSYVSANWASDKLGFPGFDTLATTEILHTKARFRDFCQSIGLKAPMRYVLADSHTLDTASTDTISFPVLVKPVDSFSGRGMSKVNAPDDLRPAIALASKESRTGQVVVERFHEGDLYSHTAFIENGVIVWDEFVDEFCTVYPYQVDCSNCPSRLPEPLKSDVRREMQRLVTALELCDGLLHTQFISDTNDFWIIECMRRCPGDLYPQLIERATGAPYTDLYVAKFLGEAYALPTQTLAPYEFVGRHTISTDTSLIASGFETQHASERMAYIPLKLSAERLEAAPYDKLGILFLHYKSAVELHGAVQNYAKLFPVIALEDQYDNR